MSSTITIYAVSLERLKQAAGSKDEALLAQIVEQQADYLENVDEIDEDSGFLCADALADILHGRVNDETPGYLYGYAFEALCRQLGEEVGGIPSISRATTWIEMVDAELQAKSSPIGLSGLVFSGCPLTLPQPDDYPVIGHVAASLIAPVLAKLATLDADGFEDDAAEVIAEITAWLEAAAATPGAALVGFLS